MTKLLKALLIILLVTFTYNIYADIEDDHISMPSGGRKIIIAADYWCPYNCTPADKNPGYLVELAKRALYIYGIDVEYKLMSWHQALEDIKLGKIDGIIGITNYQDLNLAVTNLPLEYSNTSSFTRRESTWIYDNIGSLRDKKLGLIMDYSIDDAINDYFTMNFYSSPNKFFIADGENAVGQLINSLVDAEIDIYVEDKRVVADYARRHDLTLEIRDAGEIDKVNLPIYIGLSKKLDNYEKYIEHLENGIALLKATGEYDHLRQKYNMD
ncbi:MAG: transporter substrate-binding domain-containing protein [Rickettsiaceae bacterium]|nr:transporter substrate-binding domain-containing protein [Rickettsiaceae bacterium]